MKSGYEQLQRLSCGHDITVQVRLSDICRLIDSSILPASDRQDVIDLVASQIVTPDHASHDDDIVERLEEMRTLEEDWDSYGALPPEPGSIDRAIAFAREFFGGKRPHISCTNDGKVVFEGDGGNSIEMGGSNVRDEIWIDDDPS